MMGISRRAERLMLDLLMARYDVLMHSSVYAAFYDGSDYFNLGYWRAGTHTPREASENLLDEMLARVPADPRRVVDVACGMGATTRQLTERMSRAAIVGINLSARQLDRCRVNAPRARFARADALALPFRDASVDLILCVEAIPHFEPPEIFLREAHRVLAPAGHLVLSDAVFGGTWQRVAGADEAGWPDRYAAMYRQAGFVDVRIEDVTRATWVQFDAYAARWARERWRAGAIGLIDFIRIMAGPLIAKLTLRKYLLVSARRP